MDLFLQNLRTFIYFIFVSRVVSCFLMDFSCFLVVQSKQTTGGAYRVTASRLSYRTRPSGRQAFELRQEAATWDQSWLVTCNASSFKTQLFNINMASHIMSYHVTNFLHCHSQPDFMSWVNNNITIYSYSGGIGRIDTFPAGQKNLTIDMWIPCRVLQDENIYASTVYDIPSGYVNG